MTNSNAERRQTRTARLTWVPIALTRVSPLAQRDANPARVDKIAANFDPEQIGYPTVNKRDGHFYIIDGQHRIEALKFMGWDDQQIQCQTYEGLTEPEEAEMFLKLNDTLVVNALAKFRVSVEAGRPVECDIDRVIKALDLKVTSDKIEGGISAVGTLVRVYDRSGAAILSQTLRIVRDAYGTPGMQAAVIDGVGYFCQRYVKTLDEDTTVQRLSKVQGGVNGLLGRAEKTRLQTGNAKGQCVAAAVVDIVNAGRGGSKLASWWNEGPSLAVVA